MGNNISLPEEELVQGDISILIAHLERDNYSGLEALGDEPLMSLMGRFIKDRDALLTFLVFLDRFLDSYRIWDAAHKNERFERFVRIAPLLRRDSLALVETNARL